MLNIPFIIDFQIWLLLSLWDEVSKFFPPKINYYGIVSS